MVEQAASPQVKQLLEGLEATREGTAEAMRKQENDAKLEIQEIPRLREFMKTANQQAAQARINEIVNSEKPLLPGSAEELMARFNSDKLASLCDEVA